MKKKMALIVVMVIAIIAAAYLLLFKETSPFVESLEVGVNSSAPEITDYIKDGKDVDIRLVSIDTDVDAYLKEIGEYEVTLTYKDKQYTVTLEVKDLEAPTFVGLRDIESYIGDSIQYKSNITVKDNISGQDEIDISVDASKVNSAKAGTYTATYTATDAAGNTASEDITVTIKEKPEGYVTEDELYTLVDSILDQIITDDMTEYQKLEAIYTYVRNTVSYQDGVDKPGYIQAAYLGLTTHKGECYVYWATSKALLTRAGIKEYDIHNMNDEDPSVPGHYWCLVDIGEGWYHFDTCPRKGGFDGLYKDDATIKAYSDSHKNSHKYNPDKYPTIQ